MSAHFPPLAVFAALVNAGVWGVSWAPLRWLEANGIPNLWVTCFVFAACTFAVVVTRPGAVKKLLATPQLAGVVVASGLTNVFFNGALVLGDVVRAVLLFYLMPVWVIFLARFFLRERITAAACLRIALALVGAALVLGQGAFTFAAPTTWRAALPDVLAIAGGFMFGLNNVLLRKHANVSPDARALAVFCGGLMLAPLAIVGLHLAGIPQKVPSAQLSIWFALLGFAAVVLVANLALQYGAARLTANTLSVIMISEVLFAAVSAVLAGQSSLTSWTLAGGGLIVCAAVLAVFQAPAAD